MTGFQMSWNGVEASYWVPLIPKFIQNENNPANSRMILTFWGYANKAAKDANFLPINRTDAVYILKGTEYAGAQTVFQSGGNLLQWCLDYAKAKKDRGTPEAPVSFFETATEV